MADTRELGMLAQAFEGQAAEAPTERERRRLIAEAETDEERKQIEAQPTREDLYAKAAEARAAIAAENASHAT